METIGQTALAKLLGVEVRTLRQWRVSDFKDSKKYLPAHRKDKITESFYYLDDLVAWVERNPEYKARLQSRLIDNWRDQGAMIALPETAPA